MAGRRSTPGSPEHGARTASGQVPLDPAAATQGSRTEPRPAPVVSPDEEFLLLRLLARASGEALDLTGALRAVLQAICQVTGWPYGRAWLTSADGVALDLDGAIRFGADADLEALSDVRLAERAWSSGQPQSVALPAGSCRRGLRAVVIPVWGGDAVLAVLEFVGEHAGEEDARLRGLLLVIAAQVGALLRRIRLEQQLRQAEAERAALLAAEREHSRRLRHLGELKADFTAMVAHELAGPLAAIHGLADSLATRELPPDHEQAALSSIRAEVRLLEALVSDVQLAATTEREDFVLRIWPVSAGVLLAEAARYGQGLPGSHPLRISPVPEEVHVRADPERIGQVLRNLVGNAAKHSPPGTPIELRATVHPGYVCFEVADRGLGIHPDDLTRVFEKFGRGRDAQGRRVPGAGLGLYLSRRIIRAHGSELTVTSTPGAGAVFGFELEVVP